MAPDPTSEQLRSLLAKIIYLTAQGDIQWERQLNSTHRYARWKNNLLILGPNAPLDDSKTPRYLFITPFDSPDCIEVNSDHSELGPLVISLSRAVESATADKPPADPFSISKELINRLSE
jgi:hypothetical protein